MAKKIIQDIIVEKKSIQAIRRDEIRSLERLEKERAKDEKKVASEVIPEKVKPAVHEKVHTTHMSGRSKTFLWVASIASVAGLLFCLSLLFATATVTITPKQKAVILADTYTISKDATSVGLHYQTMSITKELSKSIPTDGEEYVERKAIGKATIYNNYSSAKQRLVNNTRLETKDGLVYRTRESVDVPGMKTVNGVATPGSVEVEIIADVAGDSHNMKISDLKGDFKVPGFKGTPRYEAFSARLSADLVGGFIGTVKKVSESALNSAKEELESTLRADLLKDMYAKKPNEYTIFKDNYFIEIRELPDLQQTGDYSIKTQATIHAVMFKQTELSMYIAKNKIPEFDNLSVDGIWNDAMKVVISGVTEKPWNENTLKASFAGNANIVWLYKKDDIIGQIKGNHKTIIRNILDENKDKIIEIQASIRPQWKSTFPSNSKKIQIIDSIRDRKAQ
jgi:hypothetical protein